MSEAGGFVNHQLSEIKDEVSDSDTNAEVAIDWLEYAIGEGVQSVRGVRVYFQPAHGSKILTNIFYLAEMIIPIRCFTCGKVWNGSEACVGCCAFCIAVDVFSVVSSLLLFLI